MHPRWCRISSINSMFLSCLVLFGLLWTLENQSVLLHQKPAQPAYLQTYTCVVFLILAVWLCISELPQEEWQEEAHALQWPWRIAAVFSEKHPKIPYNFLRSSVDRRRVIPLSFLFWAVTRYLHPIWPRKARQSYLSCNQSAKDATMSTLQSWSPKKSHQRRFQGGGNQTKDIPGGMKIFWSLKKNGRKLRRWMQRKITNQNFHPVQYSRTYWLTVSEWGPGMVLQDMCQGLNSHYFHIIGDGHQPNSRGLYTHYKDSY